MSDQLVTGLITVATGIIGLAAIATFFSQRSQAPQVINSASGGLATDILAAVSPVTGNTPMINTQL